MASDTRPLSSAISQDTLQVAAYTSLPVEDDLSGLPGPRPPFLASASPISPSPRLSAYGDSDAPPTPTDSGLLLKTEQFGEEPANVQQRTTRKRSPLFWLLIALIALAILIVVIVVPVYFTVFKSKKTTAAPASSSGAPQPSGSSKPPPPKSSSSIWGGDGSTVRAANGTTFTYVNKLGGIWYHDPNNPYSDNAYPNSWTPPLNRTWDFGTNRIYGVNLGGWFVLEPFITPVLYQKYPSAIDEWSLSVLMAADTASGGLTQLEDHYKTFITEDDIAEIAGAGLNWVRIPIPFWAIDVFDGEPFLARTCWKYILQALSWCKKYGIRVKIDLHTIPGSQNGYNHSGKMGQMNFLQGTMGMANAQRTLNYIRIFTEFFTQPQWNNVVVMFGIMNEPVPGSIGMEQLRAFNYEVYRMVREISGVGEGHGPYISYHDGFLTPTRWAGFLTGADRIVIDSHPYFAFDTAYSTDPIDTGTGADAGGTWPARACERWATQFNTSRTAFGVTIAGEWSNALNDCGLFMRGTTLTATFADCTPWTDSSTWSPGTKAGLMRFAMASMDAFGDWFFWTWKINPSQRGIVESPFWSYQLGLRGGWMPTDPRRALGTCAVGAPSFTGRYEPWMTGGAGAGTLASTYGWPPATLNPDGVAAGGLPVYTATGAISTLPVPTFTNSAGTPIVSGNGWFDSTDTVPAPTPIAGCTYPNPWDALTAPIPACAVVGGVVPPPVVPRSTSVTATSTTAAAAAVPTITDAR